MEVFLCDLAEAQAAQGDRVTVVAHRERHSDSPGRATVRGVRVVRALSLGEAVHAPLSPGLPLALAREIARGADVLHAHLPNLSAFWLLALPTPPLVLHWHSDVVASQLDRKLALLYPPYRLFERALLRKARAVVATSDRYLASSEPLRDFRDKCRVVGLGLDPVRLGLAEPPQPEAIPEHEAMPCRVQVLSVGRFSYYKGFEYLVRAAALLPEVDVTIAGQGPLLPAMQALVRDLGVGDRVRLPGRVSDAELADLLRGCDLFCLPSVERTEAFGVCLLEAMAAGKPLVTTDIPGSGVGFVNRDGETGRVAPVADTDGLARALRSLANDPGMRRRMGLAARARFDAEFHIPAVARRMRDVYRSVPGRAE